MNVTSDADRLARRRGGRCPRLRSSAASCRGSSTFCSPFSPFFGSIVEDLGLRVLVEVAAQVRGSASALISSRSRAAFSNCSALLGLAASRSSISPEQLRPSCLRGTAAAGGSACGTPRWSIAEVARGGALVDAVQQARPEPPPARVVLLDVERAGAELEDPLQHLDRRPQALGAGERAVELDAAVARLAGEFDPREVLAGA